MTKGSTGSNICARITLNKMFIDTIKYYVDQGCPNWRPLQIFLAPFQDFLLQDSFEVKFNYIEHFL